MRDTERSCSAGQAGWLCGGSALAISAGRGTDSAAGAQEVMSVQSPADQGNEHSVPEGVSLSAAFAIAAIPDMSMPAMSLGAMAVIWA